MRPLTGFAPLLRCVAGVRSGGLCHPEKIQPKQIRDREMSCREITAENRRLADAARQVDSNRSVTGTDVASTLFWLSGLAHTYYDAGQTDRLINERRSWLAELYDEKDAMEELYHGQRKTPTAVQVHCIAP